MSPRHPGYARFRKLGLTDAFAEGGTGRGWTFPLRSGSGHRGLPGDRKIIRAIPVKRFDHIWHTPELVTEPPGSAPTPAPTTPRWSPASSCPTLQPTVRRRDDSEACLPRSGCCPPESRGSAMMQRPHIAIPSLRRIFSTTHRPPRYAGR